MSAEKCRANGKNSAFLCILQYIFIVIKLVLLSFVWLEAYIFPLDQRANTFDLNVFIWFYECSK